MPNQAASSRREILIVAIVFVTWGMVFLDRMAVLYLAPYIVPDLHVSPAQVSQLASVIALCWAISGLVFGVISDRVGRKAVLVPMVVLFSLLSAASGLARNFHELFLIRALLGLAEGPCAIVMMALVEEQSSVEHRGRNVGVVMGAAAIIGLAVAPVLTTQVAAHYGWRWAFFIAGLPGLIMAVLIAVCVPNSVDTSRRAAAHRIGFADLWSMLKYRGLWASAVGATGFMTWLYLLNAFAPLYITHVEHRSGTTAGFLMGAAGLGSFFVGLIGSALSDRFGRRRVLAVQAVMSMMLPLALLTHGLYATPWLLAAILFFTHGGQAISAVCIVLIPAESVPKHLAASAIGFTGMFGEIFGGVVAPLVAGALVMRHGLGEPLWLAVAGMVVVFLAAFALKPLPARAGQAVAVSPGVRSA